MFMSWKNFEASIIGDNGENLLANFSQDIIRKIQSIQFKSNDPVNAKSLQLSQLIRLLVIDNNIKFSDAALTLCEELYSGFNQKSNVKQIQALRSDPTA